MVAEGVELPAGSGAGVQRLGGFCVKKVLSVAAGVTGGDSPTDGAREGIYPQPAAAGGDSCRDSPADGEILGGVRCGRWPAK